MATTTFDMRGLTIGLNHDETQQLVSLGSGASVTTIAGALTAFGIGAAAVPYVAAALALHIAWELAAIKASDHGQGVWLNAAPQMLIGMPGVLIPRTRYEETRFDANANEGTMRSQTGDEIGRQIERGTGDPQACRFALRNETDWDKAFNLIINGQKYWVQAPPHGQAENGTWNYDLKSTSIVFHKPQFLGAWGPAGLALDDFTGLNGGEVIWFHWRTD